MMVATYTELRRMKVCRRQSGRLFVAVRSTHSEEGGIRRLLRSTSRYFEFMQRIASCCDECAPLVEYCARQNSEQKAQKAAAAVGWQRRASWWHSPFGLSSAVQLGVRMMISEAPAGHPRCK